MLAAMNLASGHGEAQATPSSGPPLPTHGTVGSEVPLVELEVPISAGDIHYVSVPDIFVRLVTDGKLQISSSPLLRNMPFELVEQLAASDEVHGMFISVNDAHGGDSEISPVRILELCYILKSQETTTVVDIMTYDESPIPMNRQLQTQLNLVNKLAPGGENVFDVVHEVLNIATPGVYGIAAPVDFNGLLSLKWLLGIAVNAIGSNDVARMKLMDVYCLVAEVLDRDDQKLSPAERVKISSVEIVGILNNSVACRAAVRLRNELDRHLLQMLLGNSMTYGYAAQLLQSYRNPTGNPDKHDSKLLELFSFTSGSHRLVAIMIESVMDVQQVLDKTLTGLANPVDVKLDLFKSYNHLMQHVVARVNMCRVLGTFFGDAAMTKKLSALTVTCLSLIHI